MITDVRKQLWSLARMVLLAVGCVLTCIGAYLVPPHIEYTVRVILAYIMILLGILAVLIGVFWSICHSMKSKIYQRGGHEQHMDVYTIQRPSSFPPSYEESQGSQEGPDSAPEFVVVVDGVEVLMSLAPPLYSQDSSDPPDCRWSRELPPPYSQVERTQQGEGGAGGQREAVAEH